MIHMSSEITDNRPAAKMQVTKIKINVYNDALNMSKKSKLNIHELNML